MEIPRRLLDWYEKNKRDLPWRKTRDPYRIWVSEIMLQQTRVETAVPYYERFMKLFPEVKALARAPLDRVLKAWENLGYYTRARHLHETARIIVSRHGGKIPDAQEQLLLLPGIGAYTAGAILSIAFDRPCAAVDGNVIRVIARLFGMEEPVDGMDSRKKIAGIAQRLVPADAPGHYNQALMDLGSGICTPRSPECPICPLAGLCVARKRGIQEALPAKKKAATVPQREAVAAVIRDDAGKVLMVKRPHRGLLAGLWSFPGSALARADTPGAKLRRTLQVELGLKIVPGKELFRVEHGYSHFCITVRVFDCRLREEIPPPGGRVEFRWAGAGDLPRLALSRLEIKILEEIKARKTVRPTFADGKTVEKRVR
ncbi:MAG TPA: A/G-specific adenine glycosylase [Syntrophales bacterium]|nr:A/G-specific adenine glycosylase [Syntrophales bacterium]